MTPQFIDFAPMTNRTLVYAYGKLALARDTLSGVSGAAGEGHGRWFWQAVNLAAKEIMRRLNRVGAADPGADAGYLYDEIRAASVALVAATAVKNALAVAPGGWVPIDQATALEVTAAENWAAAHRRLEQAMDGLVAILDQHLPDHATLHAVLGK